MKRDFSRGMINMEAPSQYCQTGTTYGAPSGLTVASRAFDRAGQQGIDLVLW